MIQTDLAKGLGMTVPIWGFTPSPAVAAAISRAGGMGVLGAIRYTDPADFREALRFMDEACEGKPYGVDVVMPMKLAADAEVPDLESMIPSQHRAFVDQILERYGVPSMAVSDDANAITGWMTSFAMEQVEIALEHPIKLIANALGPPPPDVIALAKDKGVLTAALAGKANHARHHQTAGVDIVVAQGHEAGGHCGEVTTMVLCPELVDAVMPTPVLAAGGIGSGRQMAAALALGAQGVWCGSIWLTCAEYQEEPQTERGMSRVQEKLLAAGSSDTVRSRVISGKPARMLKTEWTEAWVAESSPGTLPMPLQGVLVAEAEARIRAHQVAPLLGSPVGQIVGRMNAVRPVAQVIEEMVAECDETLRRLGRTVDPSG